jgi:hypothetical protein
VRLLRHEPANGMRPQGLRTYRLRRRGGAHFLIESEEKRCKRTPPLLATPFGHCHCYACWQKAASCCITCFSMPQTKSRVPPVSTCFHYYLIVLGWLADHKLECMIIAALVS